MNILHLIARGWRQRPARTALSIFSVAIAVAAALGTALAQSSVRLGVAQLSREVDKHPALEIVPLAGGRLSPEVVPAIGDIPGVVAAIPVVNRATLARVHGKRFRAILVGLPLDNRDAWKALALTSGSACRQRGQVILSAELAASRGAKVGDRLIVITRRGPRSATIVGLASAATLGEFAPAATLVMPLEEVQEFFGLTGRVDRIRVLVDSADVRDGVLAAVAGRLPTDLVVQVPLAPLEVIDTTLRSTELALRLSGAMSMAMAAFIILNTLRLNFSERRRDMAVIRVLGATRGQLTALHLCEGLGLGILGAALGAPLGIWLGRALEQTMGQLLQVDIPTPELPYGVLAFALALGPLVAALAALVPAMQSRKVSAIEAMGEMELRRAERFPLWAVVLGAAAWCLAVALVLLVVTGRLGPQAAIPAGLLMLVAFIAVIPAVVVPVVRAAAWLLSPWKKTEGRLASEQLLSRATRTALTVGVLVVALSSGLGLGTAIINNVDDVRGWYRRSLSGDVFLTDPAAADDTLAAQGRRDIGELVEGHEDVASVVRIRLLPTRVNGMPATGVVRDFVPQVKLPWPLSPEEETDLRKRLGSGEAAIGNVMARQLAVVAGDMLRLEVQGRVHSLRVAALVNDYMLGGRVVYLDQTAAAKMVDLGAAEFFIVTAKPNVSTESLAANLTALLADEGIVVQSFAELRRQLDGLINGVVGALWGLLAIGFVIGAVAVGNTLMLNVLEQTRELGLLRIIGMTPGQVRKMVFCESLLLGILGALLGTCGGITTALVIHYCNEPVLGRAIPFHMPWWLLAVNAGGCLVIALAAAWRPGRWAANLNVLTAISYE
jgi:putative ABC transport system permease protein